MLRKIKILSSVLLVTWTLGVMMPEAGWQGSAASAVAAPITNRLAPGEQDKSAEQTGQAAPVGMPGRYTLDSAGVVGEDTSVTIGSDGLGLISYWDLSNDDLKVAHCDDVNCSSAGLHTLDAIPNGVVGLYTSITTGSDGLGLISYWDATNGDLKVAHCNNVNCASAGKYTLDSVGVVGLHTSIAIGSDGLGLISYIDWTNDNLKVAHCNNVNCSTASIYTLDFGPARGSFFGFTSITIGSDGLGLISYYDYAYEDLKVAHCSNVNCSSAGLYTIDGAGNVGRYNSITIGSDGLGLISYFNMISWTDGDLKVAHCSNVNCSTASIYTVDSAGDAGWYTSITTGSDGLGLISYGSSSPAAGEDLRVAHCSNVWCNSATSYTVDGAVDVGSYTSIAIGSDGLGLISYFDQTNLDLKVAHCGNTVCGPWRP